MSGVSGLELDALRVVREGKPVLHGVSLHAPAGSITALLGPNGAGKSSLVLAIGGMLKADGGSIRLDGREIGGLRPEQVRAGGVAIVPEGRKLLGGLTVAENLLAASYTMTKPDRAAAIEHALELFPELADRLTQPARSMSGGQQQMLVLAQAIMSRPRVLVVDELSLGLAPVIVKRLLPVLSAVAEGGVAVLLIEQFAHLALEVATDASVLVGGQIRFAGAAAELAAHPEMLSAAYLHGDAPHPEGTNS